MIATGPLTGGLLSLVQGALYLVVAHAIMARAFTGADRVANRAFATFWLGIGGLSLVSGFTGLAAAAGLTNLTIHTTLTNVSLVVICASLWGLVYYFAYLFTGKTWWFWPIAAFYGMIYLAFMYIVAWLEPVGLVERPWSIRVDYAREFPQGWPTLVFILAFLGPPLGGALAYLSLFFTVDHRIQRYRIAMVAGAIAVWMATSFIASLMGAGGTPWWGLVSRGIGVLASLFVLAAFRPPKWIRRRVGWEAMV